LALATGMGASPAAAIDPFFPTFGNNGINVIHYDLDLEVAPRRGTLDGSAKLSIIAQKRLEEFSLDLAGLEVSRVTVNAVPADFEQADDKLIVIPREPIRRGSTFKLSVVYAGRPDPIPDPTAPGSDIELGWFTFGKASYVVSEPVGASTFYPANDEPTDKATFSITVTVPAKYTAAANGVLRSVQTTGSKKRFRWDMRQPMTTWLATVHVNQFELQLTRAADGTPIRVYYTAATPPADVDGYALAGEILIWMGGSGRPLPVRQLRQRRGGRSRALLRAGDPGDVDLSGRRGRRRHRRARAGASVVRRLRVHRQMGGPLDRRRDRHLFRSPRAEPR
jgi:hypothetical protein